LKNIFQILQAQWHINALVPVSLDHFGNILVSLFSFPLLAAHCDPRIVHDKNHRRNIHMMLDNPQLKSNKILIEFQDRVFKFHETWGPGRIEDTPSYYKRTFGSFAPYTRYGRWRRVKREFMQECATGLVNVKCSSPLPPMVSRLHCRIRPQILDEYF
jgi:hypothetical protein